MFFYFSHQVSSKYDKLEVAQFYKCDDKKRRYGASFHTGLDVRSKAILLSAVLLIVRFENYHKF